MPFRFGGRSTRSRHYPPSSSRNCRGGLRSACGISRALLGVLLACPLPARRGPQALVRGERLLAENATLSGGLTEAVDRLVAAAKGDITAGSSEAAMVRRTSTGVLLATVLASLLSSALIVWLYVDRNLVRRYL